MFNGIYPMRNIPVHHDGFDHEKLRDMLYNHEGSFVLSYNNCETIRDWYKDFHQVFPKWNYSMGTGETRIGEDVLIMTGVHVAHDCIIGNNVILVNLVALGGHVEIDDWAILGGASNVHQFCKIGKHTMIAANSKIVQDIPPFILAGKHPVKYSGINSIGLTRRGFSDDEKADIKKAYRYLFRSELNQSDALYKVKKELSDSSHTNDIISFY